MKKNHSSTHRKLKSPWLDTSSDDVTDDEILEYLAEIIADIYLSEETKKKES